MRIITILLLWAAFSLNILFSQNTVEMIITDHETDQPLTGATAMLAGTSTGTSSDETGRLILQNIPDGTQKFVIRYIGYETQNIELTFPLPEPKTIRIRLVSAADELDEIVISSTRSSRTIRNLPTRVEFITGEELDEKGNMKPGDIRMLLNESTGILTQQTSAISGNASIRIQGLDGRYTQILKDGFPIFSGAASGLGLLQTPPLDLKQVEVIKGSASTLYGGGAIAGLVNLISKTPEEERVLNFHLDVNSGRGMDLNGFYSRRFGKTGTTIFASHNRNAGYDPSGTGLTAIPKFERFVFNPKLFWYFNDRTELSLGINSAFEDRIGGDLQYIRGKGDENHSFFEKNVTRRLSSQLSFEHQMTDESQFYFKNNINHFNRAITIPDYGFAGTQISSFSEAGYSHYGDRLEWIGGLNLWTDHFREDWKSAFPLRDYRQTIAGAFVQNTWEVSSLLSLETGLRADHAFDYGTAVLPRVSALFRIGPRFTSRLGGGFGYKTPTIFTEESERIEYRNVLPVDKTLNWMERSYGGNLDFNYRTVFADDFTFSINHLFFYTYLNRPLRMIAVSGSEWQFINSSGFIHTRGTETNVKLGYEDFALYLGYTYTDARLHENWATSKAPLTPAHRINSVLIYEVDDKWMAGLEAYYYSPQERTSGDLSPSYWLCGFMAERMWEKFSLYINFENFLDVRQSRFESIFTGPVTQPEFKEIYAPLDGFLINGGIKLFF